MYGDNLSRRKFLKVGSAAALVGVVAGVGVFLAYQSAQRTPPRQGEPAQGRTWRVPEDYPTIESAVAIASAGDVIFVGPGTYPVFTVDKPLTVKGSGAGATIISGPLNIPAVEARINVRITANRASISGFSIESPIGVFVSGSGNQLSDNTVKVGLSGVVVSGSGNEVSGNTIEAGTDGVDIIGNNVKVLNNTIKAGRHGVAIATGGNKVSGNTIEAVIRGVSITIAGNNEVSANTIKLCKTGIVIISGAGDTIFNNNFIDNETQAEDNGSNNHWFKDGEGNYWSDWTSPDDDQDGIVDKPYPIAGTAKSTDTYPLASPYGP